MAAPDFDRQEILRTWRLFRLPGEVLELRIPEAGRFRTISGYFDSPEALAGAVVGLSDSGFPGIYFTVNPVKPELLARAANTYSKFAKTTTSDSDIAALHWLPIDCDAVRPAGISSTDAEHKAAISKAREVRRWLMEDLGWSDAAFVLADSGNGSHLNARIDLANAPENTAFVKRCLEALDFLFSDEQVQIDITSQNPARIWKLYGTVVRKGSSTPDRPHRVAKILEAPGELAVVSREQLQALAELLPRQEATTKAHSTRGGFDPVAYCQERGLAVHHTKSYNVGTLAILEECIFNPDHRLSAVIGGWPSGASTYRCRHHSCLDKHWSDARAVIEPLEQREVKTEPHDDRGQSEAEDDASGIITEDDLAAWQPPQGPKFECRLPPEHFIQRMMAYGEEVSDAYREYWFGGALYMLAVVTDKKVRMDMKQGILYPNLYVSINGLSGLSRKTTVVNKVEAILCDVLPYLRSVLVPAEFSPEAFIEHLSNFNHAPWIRDEAAAVLGLMKRDYMRGFKDSLMQLYDCRPYYRKLRTSKNKGAQTEFRVDDPFLNILWATTDASLAANTEQNDTLSGFLARFLFLFPQGVKDRWMPIEEGTDANSAFEQVVKDQLAGIAQKMATIAECVVMHFSPEASAYYSEWQRIREPHWFATGDGDAQQIYSRLNPTVAKLAMLFEVGQPEFDPSNPIREEFVEEACRLVDDYFMPTAGAIYELVGTNAEKNVIDKMLMYLKKHGGKITVRKLMQDLKIKRTEFNEYLGTLAESGLAEIKTVARTGHPGRGTDYILLTEEGRSKVANVSNVAKVAKVASVGKGNSDNSDNGRFPTLATQATSATNPTPTTPDKSISSIVDPIASEVEAAERRAAEKEAHFAEKAEAITREKAVESPADGPEAVNYEQAVHEDFVALVRFSTDYATDMGGRVLNYAAGDECVAPLDRALTWKQRGAAAILWIDVSLAEATS